MKSYNYVHSQCLTSAILSPFSTWEFFILLININTSLKKKDTSKIVLQNKTVIKTILKGSAKSSWKEYTVNSIEDQKHGSQSDQKVKLPIFYHLRVSGITSAEIFIMEG